MSEFSRAFELMDRLDELTAERLEPTPYGPVVVHSRLNRVHDLNFLRAEQPGDATAKELAAEAERVQGAAGVAHRRVNIRDEEQRERLEPEFVALGWMPERFVLMVLRGEPDRPPEHDVLEVDESTMRPLWAEAIRAEPHGKDERLVQQILEHRRDVSEALPTRLFAAKADGRLVAHTELYSYDGVGQVENVVTLEPYRGRGLARALVLRAVAESRAAGNDLTFLVADAERLATAAVRATGLRDGRPLRAFLAPQLIVAETSERGAPPRSLSPLRPKRYGVELLPVTASRSISEPPGSRHPKAAQAWPSRSSG
jgi:ribosomal protein S18 acetylase RimI-like enzyme